MYVVFIDQEIIGHLSRTKFGGGMQAEARLD